MSLFLPARHTTGLSLPVSGFDRAIAVTQKGQGSRCLAALWTFMTLLFCLAGISGIAHAQSLSSLTVSPGAPFGGDTVSGTVTLTAAATGGSVTITLTSSQPGVLTAPASVVVPTGQTQAFFTATTVGVTVPTAVTLTASDGTVTKTASITVYPPQVSAFWLNTNSLVGGGQTSGYVQLTANAPTGGMWLTVTSSNSQAATIPGGVFVPAGSSFGSFIVQTTGRVT